MVKRLILGAFGALMLITGALAGEGKALTADQAKRFVATLPTVSLLGDQIEADGKLEKLAIDTVPKAGEAFTPYSNAVAGLKDAYPSDYASLAKAVKAEGFNMTEWGRVGDRVMVAYLALKMQEQDPESLAMMQGMDESMLNMVPPEMRTQLEGMFAMLETVKNVSAEDKAAVATVKTELDSFLELDEKH